MNENSEVIDDFEDLLKKWSSKKTSALYITSADSNRALNTFKTGKLCSAKDVLANVAKQIKAIQNADTACYKRVDNKLDKYKNREFLTVDMIPSYSEVPQNIPTKFDTQCVTDTQLINVIENVEIIDAHTGITQEFDRTFCQKSDEEDSDVKLNDGSLKSNEKEDIVIDERKDTSGDKIEDDRQIEQDSKLFQYSNLITCEMDTITCQSVAIDNDDEVIVDKSQATHGINKCDEILDSCKEDSRNISPVLIANRRKSISPLVVDLYTFENFENLALPIIETHEDLQIAKNLINSQILGREIGIFDNIYEKTDRESPVIGKIEVITTNINKDDIKYIDDSFGNNDESINENICCSQTNKPTCEKKKPKLNYIKTEIVDEILFSSDEECDYLNKQVQELPLTCALETSFYDKSDVLDKTMYVGFQTASNKSIQVQTESFYKAKSILSGIGNEGTETTLTDIVKIFDSGKAVSENVQNISLNNDNPNNEVGDRKSLDIEQFVDTNIPPISENHIGQDQKIDDIFQNIRLREFEDHGHVEDDIVMSQIIELKSISKPTKPNNIITPPEKMSDTFDNVALTALEQNNQIDEDVPMSQIIEFKSIRAPKSIENVSNTSNAFARPAEVLTKRKFEGFKTASNKKIKLSDKALARCKKVFQDIDLNDSEDINCTKESEIDIADYIPKLSHLSCAEIDKYTKPDFYGQGKKFKTEDVDLQINDQILKEFEETPFEEANNNAYMGFKTASNKNITISDIALLKSKYLLNDIITSNEEKDNDIKTKTVECDDSENQQDIFKEPTVNIRKVSQKQMKVANEAFVDLNCIKKPSNHDFIIFKPEPNEKITVSEQCNHVDKTNYIPVESEFNCGIDTQDFFGEELTRIEDLFKENEMENKKLGCPIFQGFQTASDKAIVISEKALQQSKKLFEDITNKDDDTRFQIDDSKSKQKYENEERIESRNTYSTCVGYNDNCIKTQSKGFIVNAGEQPYIVEPEKLIDVPNFKGPNKEAPKFVGFQTASSKPIRISAEAIEKTKRMLLEFEHGDDIDNEKPFNPETSTKTFVGFQTASNKQIKISAKALAESKHLLNVFELKTDFDKAVSDNRTTIVTNDLCLPSTSKFAGFQTASNKEVKISKEALARSKQLFQDVFSYDSYDKETNSEKQELEENLKQFKGFQTASNKTVSISEEALQKSRELLNEIDTNDKQEEQERLPIFREFQTASSKEVVISKEALARSKKILQDVDIFGKESDKIEQKDKPNQFKGFQTASYKKVNISEKALEKSRDLFRDITTDEQNEGATVFRGFQTANNKKVTISDEALARSKQMFQDIDIFAKESEMGSDKIQQEEAGNLFKGFQTTNNKKVNISDKALEISRKLLEGIDYNDLEDKNSAGIPKFQGFQTASNKTVKISANALAKSKKLFEDINLSQLNGIQKITADSHTEVDNDVKRNIHYPSVDEKNSKDFEIVNKYSTKVCVQSVVKTNNLLKDLKEAPEVKIRDKANVVITDSKNKLNINAINSKINNSKCIDKDVIDTQILNDFEETLNTEDFCKSTPKSKRSGSPILSCPKAKKRKFETPYRSHKNIEPKTVFIPPKLAKSYNFDDGYKKTKKYTYKDIENLEKGTKNKTAIDPYICKFNFDNLLDFEFFNARNDYTAGKMDTEEIKKIFLGSVNKKIVPDGWLENHIKLIIWKLLSYEIKYPNVMRNICTVRNVLEQLKYRYDKELYHVQRPILRKILEKDEVPSKTMVLCVAAIYVDNASVTSVSSSSHNVELLLTDGWYCLKASIDRMLVGLVAKGAIVVGTKLAVCGAELINCEQGIAPWEDTSSVRLKLSGNSVRRARWWAGLGLRSGRVRCALHAARADGGRVAAVRLLLSRVYPPLYVERMDDGSTVTRSERLEHIRQMQHESEREAVMEKLYEEVEKEMSDHESQDSEGCTNDKGLESGSQISKCIKKSKDPDEYRAHLTTTQNRMLEEHSSKQREKLIERVREKFKQKLEKSGLKTDRNVVPLLKVRVAGIREKNGVEVTKGYLSIWKPSAAVLELVREGAWVEILNVTPTGIRNSEVQLSAGRQTVFNSHKQTNDKLNLYANTLRRNCYEIKEITQNPAMTTDYNEIDTVGIIFCIEPSSKEFHQQSFQNLYLADADKNIICVNFWGGLKKFGFENVLDTGQIITCVNLQKRAGNTMKCIPQYRVTEFSYFTKTPKDKKAMEITNELSNKLSKIINQFCQDCMLLKSNHSVFKTRNIENVSPYRFDYNVSKNMVSPLRKYDANLNLTGLDFESSFDSQEISPQALLRKKKVNEKIEKIRLNYGEPPPLASIQIINKSKNASATYKSPLISNTERSIKVNAETPGLQNVASPISMNRTYVKNMNPVKLNFSSTSNLNDSVDHFAEDFEASPPLSLDSDVVN